jgi:hypothetical protein
MYTNMFRMSAMCAHPSEIIERKGLVFLLSVPNDYHIARRREIEEVPTIVLSALFRSSQKESGLVPTL